ncbi:hypothetical protein BGZ57DRAFT_419767 [Hyaloscypha finlandica]|nr:hypothetical protein BGZ57DRAFT_419767 [Hyaloscypha finlandica]
MSTNLFCTSDPRQCDGREEAKQEPSRSQGGAAKPAASGARARDRHDELFFSSKKSTREADIQISARVAAPLLLWACRGPVVDSLLTSRLSLCMQGGYRLIRGSTQPHLSTFGQEAATQPSPAPTRPRPGPALLGARLQVKKCTLLRDMASVLNLRRYDPLSTKTPPLCVKTPKASKISCCPSISLPWPPESAIHSVETSVEGSMQLPDPFPISYPT